MSNEENSEKQVITDEKVAEPTVAVSMSSSVVLTPAAQPQTQAQPASVVQPVKPKKPRKKKPKKSIDDEQEEKIIKAETEVYQGLEFTSIKEAQDFVDQIIKSKWWTKSFKFISKVEVEENKDPDSISGECIRRGLSVKVVLPKVAMRELPILIFLSRIAVDQTVEGKVRRSANLMLKLVRRFMGEMTWKELKGAYALHGIKYSKSKTKSVSL